MYVARQPSIQRVGDAYSNPHENEFSIIRSDHAQVEGVEPQGEMFDARIKVMCEYVEHHVKEEQNEMFPKAKSTGLDMVELGARLSERKVELLAQPLQ